jgi:hypothetical protein
MQFDLDRLLMPGCSENMDIQLVELGVAEPAARRPRLARRVVYLNPPEQCRGGASFRGRLLSRRGSCARARLVIALSKPARRASGLLGVLT